MSGGHKEISLTRLREVVEEAATMSDDQNKGLMQSSSSDLHGGRALASLRSGSVKSFGRQLIDPPLDADQQKAYDQLIELLLVGGYFRARIVGLSQFDKVVGGLCWCITSCYEDVDVDLNFVEEASIGQKIALAEEIIKSLQRMKCPYRLNPNQIQGGSNTADYVNIYPIVQWLVKKVIETREETGDLNRQFSLSQFAKANKLPADVQFDENKPEATKYLHDVIQEYVPARKFRRHGKRLKTTAEEEESVLSCLLEYGEFYRPTRPQVTTKAGKNAELEQKLGAKDEKLRLQQEQEYEEKESALKKNLKAHAASDRVDRGILGGLLDTDNIQQMDEQFDENGELASAGEGKLFGVKLHEQNVSRLEKEINQQKTITSKLTAEHEEYSKQLAEAQEAYSKRENYNKRVIHETKKLDELETPENAKVLQMLKTLVALNENLRNQEAKFKANCKRQMAQLKEQIRLLEEDSTGGLGIEGTEIEQTYQKDLEKLQKIKALQSKKNRDIALVQRKADEIPSRIELSQYQRQFVELYEQVAGKLTETRQYYNTYNTCEDTKTYLSKEVSILQSIHDNYKTAMSNKAAKEQFITSLQSITESVKQNLEKMEQKLSVEKDSKGKLTESYTQLVEKERLYYKATKEFLEECRKNEQLQAQMSG